MLQHVVDKLELILEARLAQAAADLAGEQGAGVVALHVRLILEGRRE
jgi:hypothetical protein